MKNHRTKHINPTIACISAGYCRVVYMISMDLEYYYSRLLLTVYSNE